MKKNKLNFCHVTVLKGIAHLQIFQSSIKMRYLKFLLIVLFSFCLSNIYSQDFHTETIKFIPKENGHILNIPFSWKFIWFSGDVKIAIRRHKKNEITTNTYIYKGKRYTSADIGTEAFTQYDIGLTSIRADVYHNAYFLGNIYMYHVSSIWAGGAGGQTYDLSKSLGIDDEEYKDKINGLSLRNLKLEDFSGIHIYLEAKIKKKEKEKNLNKIVSEADELFLSGDLTNAQIKYKEARKIDNTNRYVNNRLNEIKEKLNADLSNQNDKTSDWDDYESSSEDNSASSSYRSDNASTSSSSGNNNMQIYYDVQKLQDNTQRQNQIVANLATDLGGLAAQMFASNAAFKEEQRRKREEEERIRLEKERKEREIEMAWEKMTKFELKFSNFSKKDFYSVSNKSCVYFYFGSITKNKYNKSGSIKLSNIFPVYCYSDGSWPYMSDISNKIKSAYGKVTLRGYFMSQSEAQKDKNDAAVNARRSHINSVSLNAYRFTFNESSGTTTNNKDFWGKEESGNKNASDKDFWGNETNTNKKTPTAKDTKEKDFWGDELKPKKLKTDTIKTKTDKDFWK